MLEEEPSEKRRGIPKRGKRRRSLVGVRNQTSDFLARPSSVDPDPIRSWIDQTVVCIAHEIDYDRTSLDLQYRKMRLYCTRLCETARIAPETERLTDKKTRTPGEKCKS